MRAIHIIAIILAFIGAGFLLCPRNPGVDQVDPEVLLDNTIKAERSVSYTADQIYEAVYLGEPHRQRVNAVHPHNGRVSVSDKDYGLIRSNYVPLVEGEDKVAGREAWTLRLMPNRDKYPWRKHAPWKQLWVDKKTNVVLASREWTSANTIKRSMRTESIAYTNQLPDIPVVMASASRKHAAHNDSKMESIKPRYIPGGFCLVNARCVGRSGCRFTYSDGLYCINIIGEINPSIRSKSETSIRDCGQCLIYSRDLTGHSVIVTADLPSGEFEKLINSIN